jgi:hypothetical protein
MESTIQSVVDETQRKLQPLILHVRQQTSMGASILLKRLTAWKVISDSLRKKKTYWKTGIVYRNIYLKVDYVCSIHIIKINVIRKLFLCLLIWHNIDLWHIMAIAFHNFQVPRKHIHVSTEVNNADNGKYELHSWIAPWRKLKGVRFGELSGQEMDPVRWFSNQAAVYRNVLTLWICGSTLSC